MVKDNNNNNNNKWFEITNENLDLIYYMLHMYGRACAKFIHDNSFVSYTLFQSCCCICYFGITNHYTR